MDTNSKLNLSGGPGFSAAQKKEMLKKLLRERKKTKHSQRIERVSRSADGLELSFAQQRLWYLDQMNGGSSEYNIPSCVRVTGPLDIAAAEKALRRIIVRHESLRTVFVDSESGPRQIVREEYDFSIRQRDLSQLDKPAIEQAVAEQVSQDIIRPFDLAADLLIRVSSLKQAQDNHVLVFVIHHIAADAWSMNILMEEFLRDYQAIAQDRLQSEDPLEIQYADYAQWQKSYAATGALEKQLDYWRRQLSDLPQVHSLPLDKARPQNQTHVGEAYAFSIEAEVCSRLSVLAKHHNATLFMVLHAALALLLSRYSNETDIVIGTPVANRRHKQIESLIGCFANMLILRTEVDPEISFTEFLAHVREVNLNAQENQDISFDQLLEELNPPRSKSHSPLFQIMLSYEQDQQHGQARVVSDLSFEALQADLVTSKYDLILFVFERGDYLRLCFEYNVDLFTRETIVSLSEHMSRLLTALAENPETNVLALPLLNERQAADLTQLTQPKPANYSADTLLHQLFVQQTIRAPERTAIVDEYGQLSYAELFQLASAVAAELTDRGVKVDELVAVRLPRGRWQIAATLGIMMAGAAYLPMETHWPNERCRKICEKAACRYLLIDQLSAEIGKSDIEHLPVGELRCVAAEPSAIVERARQYRTPQTPTDLAYVIFTSGSTGEPKGVAIEHHAAVNTILDINERYGIGADDKVLAVSALSFDLSVYDFFGLLAVGGQIVIPHDHLASEPKHWHELVNAHRISLWNTVPVSASLLVEQMEAAREVSTDSIRHVLMSGDWIAPNLPKRLWECFPGSNVYSLGGATEGSIWSIHYPIKNDTSHLKSVPYGRALTDQSFHILNQKLQFVPHGVVGELFIGGRGVARCYLGDPELTKQRYIWHEVLGQRLYRTGDMGRYMPDGNIEFIGRVDHQVKLRGFRIELGEIEAILNKHPAIEESVAMIRGEGDARRIVAYVVPHGQIEVSDQGTIAQDLKAKISDSLPDYMIPAAFMVLPEWPVTANGKLNKTALPEPEVNHSFTYQEPGSQTEQVLASLWQQLLSTDQAVSANANFFELGGHSLLASRMVTQINNDFDCTLLLKDVFELQNLNEIALHIDYLQAVGPKHKVDDVAKAEQNIEEVEW